MTTQNATFRLLILNDSFKEAERLISMLNNAGRPVRGQHADSLEALSKLLQEKKWDLLIGLDTTENVPPQEAIRLVKKLNKDVPLILQSDRDDSHAVAEGMKAGAVDVVTLDEDQHLLQVINRELDNREEREKRRFAERRFNEISRRNQQLLDSSRDAIAFVQDGMFLYTNDSFAELLAYESRDDLECMPIIDVIHESAHDQIKSFLKDYMLKSDEDIAKELSVVALLESGEEKPLNIEVSKSNYDEEPCIQFLVRAKAEVNSEELEAKLEEIKNQDVATGLFNKNYLVEKLEQVVDDAVNKNVNSALLHIGIENFLETVQEKLGLASADIALGSIAAFAKSQTKERDTLCRFGEGTFMHLMPGIDATKALERAEELRAALSDYIVDIDGTTLHFQFTIGIALITDTTTDTDVPIDHAIKALELVRADAKEDASVNVRLYEPEVTSASTDKKDIAKMVQDALDDGKFKLLFQPILSLRGSNKEHYEVLLRMLDAEGNEVSPNEFLAAASKIAATTKMDRWVILESIKVLSEHRSQGHNTRLLVNLSRESMLDATLAPWLSVAFKAAKLPTEAIIFQLNEIDVNDHLNVASTFTADIAEIGCECSINRFGCALNPFNALKNLTANYVKIDGSFTEELQKNSEDSDALKEIASELHQMDKITIVPFVENASVLSKLWQSGVHYIQGYYLQEPADQMNYDFDMES